MAGGPLTHRERSVITTYTVERGLHVDTVDVKHLARRLHRTPRAVRRFLRQVRAAFLLRAPDYVRLHQVMIQQAVAAGPQCRSFTAALRSCQWAMEAAGVTRALRDTGNRGVEVIVGTVDERLGDFKAPGSRTPPVNT
jgi:hypothetical protein